MFVSKRLLIAAVIGSSCTSCEPPLILVQGFKYNKCPNQGLTVFFVLLAAVLFAVYIAYTTKKKQKGEAPKLRS